MIELKIVQLKANLRDMGMYRAVNMTVEHYEEAVKRDLTRQLAMHIYDSGVGLTTEVTDSPLPNKEVRLEGAWIDRMTATKILQLHKEVEQLREFISRLTGNTYPNW